MGYRSLKRYFGETHLERKCQLWFGVAMLLLVGGAFWWVGRICSGLGEAAIQREASTAVTLALYDLHWQKFTRELIRPIDLKSYKASEISSELMQEFAARITMLKAQDESLCEETLAELLEEYTTRTFNAIEEGKANRAADSQKSRDANWFSERRDEFAKDLPVAGFREASFIAPENDPRWKSNRVTIPTDPTEVSILERLRERRDQQLRREDPTKAIASEDAKLLDSVAKLDPSKMAEAERKDATLTPVWEALVVLSKEQYVYYQPVYWRQSCSACHLQIGDYVRSRAESAMAEDPEDPFVVVKVPIPYQETRNAINRTSAILSTGACVTVAVAMIALWTIVRYVIVKPLSHLRQVSEAIAEGRLDTRAELHTGDEFEDLSGSFNKMLRSLMDTQLELRRVNSNLDVRLDELAQLNMRLYETNRVKSDFLSNVSHELRTPLNSIIGFSEVLEGIESLTDKQKRYVQNIQKSGRVLLDMINDILDLAKLEAGKTELRLSEFDIRGVIEDQCDVVRKESEKRGIDLLFHVEQDLPKMYQDKTRVQQILQNLLSNAIKFTPEGGRVSIAAKGHANGRVEITVADTGVGIAQQELEEIFEKFRQGSIVRGGDNLTREYSGTGLGLSIVKELCKLLGGEVSVESELGKGSTFRVLLPWMQLGPVRTTSLVRHDDNGAGLHVEEAETP